MKTLLACALLFASTVFAQTVTISISGVSPAVIADIRTHWLDQVSPSIGTLAGSLDATTASVTIAISQASLSSAQPMPAVGQSVLIEGEPATVTAVSGLNVTISRGTLPMATLQTHSSGVSVTILKYTDPWMMLVTEAIRPWTQSVISGLGSRSVTLGAAVTGSVSQ